MTTYDEEDVDAADAAVDAAVDCKGYADDVADMAALLTLKRLKLKFEIFHHVDRCFVEIHIPTSRGTSKHGANEPTLAATVAILKEVLPHIFKTSTTKQ